MVDELDDFIEYDAGMGGDEVTCPYCGAEIPAGLLMDDEIECPACGKRFERG